MKCSKFLLLALIALLAACEEEPPFIDLTPKDTSLQDTTYVDITPPAAQARNVLIEDFTGVRCPNCPLAQAKAHSIDSIYPGRIVIIGLHPSQTFVNFTYPYNMAIDFRTKFAEDIMTMLTPPQGLPSGVVNRKIFPGETSRMIDYSLWQTKAEQELLLSSPVNIEFVQKDKLDDSTLLVAVKVAYSDTSSAQHSLSLMLTESHIIGPQELPGGDTTNNYEHNHVLRTMGTLFSGDLLVRQGAQYEKGRTYIRQFKVKVKNNWVLTNCDLVAVITEEAPALSVIQVKETPAQ